nr:hypothetical protein [Tanacetum cinerariifolium]
MKIDPHHYNAESDLIESLLNHDSSIIPSSSKIDSLLDEFAGELILLKLIPPEIDETDCDPEEDIRLIERLLYDSSSPRPPKEFKNLKEKQLEEAQAAKAQSWKFPVCYDDDDDEESSNYLNDNIISELPSYSAVIPTEPIDSLKIYSNPLFDEEIIPMEIDQHSFNVESDLIESKPNHDSSITISSKTDSLFDEFAGELTLLKSFPSRIDETDCHPEKEIHDDDSERDILVLEELLDNYSLSLPTNESYHFDIPSPYRSPAKPPDGNTGTLNIKMMGDVSDQKVPIPNLTITRILNQEKSPGLFSHQGFEAFQPSAECPMMINGKNTPL